MPINIVYNAEKDRFEHNLSGRVTARDVGDAVTALYAHPRWEGGKPRLISMDPTTDLSEMTLETLERDVVDRVRPLAAGMTHRPKAAMVASEDTQKSISKLYGLMPGLKAIFDVEIFTSEAAATAWLESEEPAR